MDDLAYPLYSVTRVAVTGGTSWEYHPPAYLGLNGVAQGREGTVYFTEMARDAAAFDHHRTTSYTLVALDGASGAVKFRMPLPRHTYRTTRGTFQSVCQQFGGRYSWTNHPNFTPPFVGADDAVYLGVYVRTEVLGSVEALSTYHYRVDLLRVSPTGVATYVPVKSKEGSYITRGAVTAVRPDGRGGVLLFGADAQTGPWVSRYTDGTIQELSAPFEVPGNDVVGRVAHHTSSYSSGQLVHTAHDPTTGAVLWTTPGVGLERPIQARPDGGVMLFDDEAGLLTGVDGQGVRETPDQLPANLAGVLRTDVDEIVAMVPELLPGGQTGYDLTKFVTSASEDRTVYPPLVGANAEQRRGRFGIFVKGHPAYFVGGWGIPQQHASIRVVPQNQEAWIPTLTSWEDGQGTDHWGNYFVTFGANDGGVGDTGGGDYLVAGRNRASDRDFPPKYLTRVASEVAEEGDHMLNLNALASHYITQHNAGPTALRYKAVPNNNGDDTYNSNSFAGGLLDAAQLPRPPITNRSGWTSRYPGWSKPVPVVYFGPVP